LVFHKEQAGNKKAAQDKEQVDANPSMAGGRRPNTPVIEHDEKHSDAPQDIKPLVSHVPTFSECVDLPTGSLLLQGTRPT
jgi:hypothetical protein